MHYASQILYRRLNERKFGYTILLRKNYAWRMKTLFFILTFLLFSDNNCFGQVNPNSTYVNGYYKSNGTYVNGYYRTTPNNTVRDNYSTYPNVNPHTGKQGTIQPNYYQNNSRNTYPNTPRVTTPNNYYYRPRL